jgi:hypothetical protein
MWYVHVINIIRNIQYYTHSSICETVVLEKKIVHGEPPLIETNFPLNKNLSFKIDSG